MKNKLGISTKILLFVAAAGLVLVLYTPIWRIELDAPQYPEGLSLSIHANGLKGNVDIINGLNHYIGMKTLHNDDFFEFKLLPYLILFFAAAFTSVALLNRKRWLNILFAAFVIFGIAAMYDFWRWEYDYGHNLNPNAAIVVPGMAYQPPLIGFKQLLNFGAYSVPDIGGWIFIAAGAILLVCIVLEWKRAKKTRAGMLPGKVGLLFLLPALLNSCQPKPDAIVTGKDTCYFCKMGITDAKYAGEILTKKGKVYKFDDAHCLLAFTKANTVEYTEVKDIYLADFAPNHTLINVNAAFLLQSDSISGPMNGHVIAFKNSDSLKKMAIVFKGKTISWNELIK